MIPLTPVFETYWRFAAARQNMYLDRLRELPRELWTDDPILAQYRFTNVYRAADRVSQYLIRHVIYSGVSDAQRAEDTVFRVLLFKLFNKIETWELLRDKLGEPSYNSYRYADYAAVLTDAVAHDRRLYSGAYLMPPVRLGEAHKCLNHLRLLELIMLTGLPHQLNSAPSLEAVYTRLRQYPGIGDFLAYQYTIDLNYSGLLTFSEMDFVVAGPGARSGIRKCFGALSKEQEISTIRDCADNQEHYFAQLGIDFTQLNGARPLQLIDCQGLFCETDKYARVAHPTAQGTGDRTRIKQNYRPSGRPLDPPWFPPKWGINDKPA